MKTLALVLTLVLILSGCDDESDSDKTKIPEGLPKVEDATFSNPTVITNIYYGPAAGQTYMYMGGEVGKQPEEEIRIERRNTTKIVMGISCLIQRDVVTLNGIVIEDTDDWLAQDDDGNVWYFGEFVKNYNESGQFEDNDGSWEAGADEALPGYWIPANPTVGQAYYQEYYEDEAEDQGEVIALGETVSIGLGTYENCVVTKDFTRLEQGVYEKKYYAPGIGLIKEEKFEGGELTEVIELTEIIE